MLPPQYDTWLDEILTGESDPPISLSDYQKLGVAGKMKFVSGLGFGDYWVESMKETLFESDEFDTGLYLIVDGSEDAGKAGVLTAVMNTGEGMLLEAADALEVVLDNLHSDETE